jgi:hypothetical protein
MRAGIDGTLAPHACARRPHGVPAWRRRVAGRRSRRTRCEAAAPCWAPAWKRTWVGKDLEQDVRGDVVNRLHMDVAHVAGCV